MCASPCIDQRRYARASAAPFRSQALKAGGNRWAGCFDPFSETARIGFQHEWLARIAESGYGLVEDSFVPLANASEPDEGGQARGQLATDVDRNHLRDP